MTFSMSKSELLLILNPIMRVVPKKTTLPVLLSVKIDIVGKEIKITGSNNANTIICKGELIESSEDKSFLVDAEPLFKIVKSIPDQPLGFEVDGEVAIIHATGKLSIPEMGSIETYPITDVVEKAIDMTVDSSELIRAVGAVSGFTGENELYPQYSAVCLNLERSEAAATDGNNISYYPVKTLIGSGSILLMKESALILKGLMLSDSIKLYSDGKKAVFDSENITLISTLMDVIYPAYERIVKAVEVDNKAKSLTISVGSLKSAINRLEAVGEKNTFNKIFLTINLGESLSLKAENAITASGGSENLTGEYLGESLSLKIESGSFLQHLSCAEAEDVKIGINAGNRPVLIESGNFRGIMSTVG